VGFMVQGSGIRAWPKVQESGTRGSIKESGVRSRNQGSGQGREVQKSGVRSRVITGKVKGYHGSGQGLSGVRSRVIRVHVKG